MPSQTPSLGQDAQPVYNPACRFHIRDITITTINPHAQVLLQNNKQYESSNKNSPLKSTSLTERFFSENCLLEPQDMDLKRTIINSIK